MYVVILAGGSGTRFWPLSRTKTPKQLMSVFGGRSMLQRTVERVLPLRPSGIIVVTNALQAEETSRQLAELGSCPIEVVEEPVGRNTAPAIALAAAVIARRDPDATMLVLPADHYIRDEVEFRRIAVRAAAAASGGALVTLGIEPTRPETGYGYIEAGPSTDGGGACPVKRFVEKPDLARALEFLDAGNFYWNSGMFIWKVGAIRDELARLMPDLAAAMESLSPAATRDPLLLKQEVARIYGEIGSESIDYGVMERAARVLVIPASFGWSDVGSWSALPEVIDAGVDGNVAINVGELICHDARESLVYGNGKVAALVGVEGVIVVDTADALLVCHRDRAQDVKKIVEKLQQKGMTDYL
jgi:mannose-1-phosphate guanylyltransferase